MEHLKKKKQKQKQIPKTFYIPSSKKCVNSTSRNPISTTKTKNPITYGKLNRKKNASYFSCSYYIFAFEKTMLYECSI